MRRLVYTSTAARMMAADDLNRILAASRANNARDGISGLLVYHDGCFLQVLEGEPEAVEQCYARIRRNPLHHSAILMMSETAPVRVFDGWRMAYKAFDDLPATQQRQFTDIRALSEEEGRGVKDHPAVGAVLLAFLSSFRDLDIAV
ncbi:MAG: BLUF domain-containing protein [Pseudomonadota bacterium]